MSLIASEATQNNGGYYAIKGFVFQFDKSILEILSNPTSDIEIEQIQDIATESYYIQVKHKESQKYTPSKIRPAVIQLLRESQVNTLKRYSLYCYFKDKKVSRSTLTLNQLDTILGKDSNKFSTKDKNNFIRVFVLEFANDFQKQFDFVIKQIKSAFDLNSIEEAAMHHTSFRGSILEVAIKKQPAQRKMSFAMLQGMLNNNEKIVFETAYSKYLTNARYLSYIKKRYFTHKKINIKNSERLFVIDIDDVVTNYEIIQITTNISNKYYIKDISGAPYIYLNGLSTERSLQLKRKLWTEGLFFSDGTHFNGDIFRLESLIKKVHNDANNKVKYKLIPEEYISEVLKRHKFDELFIFAQTTGKAIIPDKTISKKFYLNKTRDILKTVE